MSLSFETPAEALAWMQKRHGIAKGLIADSAEPDPKDKPPAPEEGDDEPAKTPEPAPEAPTEEPAKAEDPKPPV